MSMKWTGAVIAALTAATALAGCGSSKPDGCVTPDKAVVQAIVEGQKRPGLTLGPASAVKGEQVYFVAAKYEIGGDTGAAVWATTSLDSDAAIRSAEALSATLTNWPRVDGIDAGAQPVRDALACIG